MRCHICNAVLAPAEIKWSVDHKDWEPCSKCLEAIDEVFNTEKTEDEIDKELALDDEEIADDHYD